MSRTLTRFLPVGAAAALLVLGALALPAAATADPDDDGPDTAQIEADARARGIGCQGRDGRTKPIGTVRETNTASGMRVRQRCGAGLYGGIDWIDTQVLDWGRH
ncbi:hypothetical protein ABZ470_40675 [Streptosporangium sp. NPDC020072]|uniref:hypothetical protein n=1 Tax=unclassified Streptosporangium TaxID=2632669 RepID=UPI0034399D03